MTESTWRGLRRERLEGEDVLAVTRGELAYVHVPGFLDLAWAGEVSARFLGAVGPLHTWYDYETARTLRVGRALLQELPHVEAYFDAAPATNAAVRALFEGGDDALASVRAALAAATGWEDLEPEEAGRAYATDLVQAVEEGSRAALHSDARRRELGLAISSFPLNLTWNVYLQMPERGGDLVVYDRAWRPVDERFRRARGSDYLRGILEETARAAVRPASGDLVIFDADRYHEVATTEGPTRRVTAHSFIAADAERGAFMVWS